MKRYDIGQGTMIIASFETKKELDKYFDNMKDIDRHFCRVYDWEAKTDVPGWEYQYTHELTRRY